MISKPKKIFFTIIELIVGAFGLIFYKRKPPSLHIAGFPKAGTTAFVEVFAKHKRYFLPFRKESHFYTTSNISKKQLEIELFPIDNWVEENIFLTNQKFLYGLSSSASLGRHLIECTPSNVLMPERIINNGLNPNLPTIILVRDPIEASISHYEMQLRKGLENRSFEEILENFMSNNKDINYRRDHIGTYKYSKIIPLFLSKFKNVLLLPFDNLNKPNIVKLNDFIIQNKLPCPNLTFQIRNKGIYDKKKYDHFYPTLKKIFQKDMIYLRDNHAINYEKNFK